jgi:hypothetical protein
LINNSKRIFDVVIDADKKGSSDGDWSEKTISVDSIWDRGSEQEKFEVLSSLRKLYNSGERADIRGQSQQTPSQIAQSEGFTRLSYRGIEPSTASIDIVNALRGYSRLAPH